jgi:energy-coupling factor transporter ATP-binding protein EcfA2/GNAT superfamily N-acetyltransferase
MLFTINASFVQEPQGDSRAAKIAEAFGIGLQQKTFTIFDNAEIDVKPTDIVYITGDSGGGKSVLVGELTKRLNEYEHVFGKTCTEGDLEIKADELLIDSIGKNVEEAISYLSFAGLNDAYLFLRCYRELSDGQKYRFKIAKIIATKADTIIMDEFCSTLDRETAKAVAFCIQKLVRRAKKTLIVATAHGDLITDLAPSVLIRKDYGYGTDVSYPGRTLNLKCSLMDGVTIQEGTIDDWHSLEYFHYRAGMPYGIHKIFVAKMSDRVVGAIVYSNSPLSSKPRNQYLGSVPTSEEINSDFIIISRVVVLPKFRGIGLAVKLVRETLPLVGKKYVETIAVMAKYNPFFANAGMKEIKYQPDKDWERTLVTISKFGFNPDLCGSIDHNVDVIRRLDGSQLSELRAVVLKAGRNAFGDLVSRVKVSREDMEVLLQDKQTLAEVIQRIATLSQAKCYYIWQNPELMLEVKAK